MFHGTNYGSFGCNLKRYADLDGYVPEAGDNHDDLRWDGMTEWDDESWSDFVDEAMAATKEASSALEAWQQEA